MRWFSRKQPRRSLTPESDFYGPHNAMPARPLPLPSTARVDFDARGAVAVGNPASGGIITKRVTTVDLLYLHVPRLAPTPRPEPADPANEKTLCDTLQTLGAKWWRKIDDYDDAANGVRPKTDIEKIDVFVGWPLAGGGVWVLEVVNGRLPADFGRYEMCVDMDERCKVLEQCGARFYATPTECEALTPHIRANSASSAIDLRMSMANSSRLVTSWPEVSGRRT